MHERVERLIKFLSMTKIALSTVVRAAKKGGATTNMSTVLRWKSDGASPLDASIRPLEEEAMRIARNRQVNLRQAFKLYPETKPEKESPDDTT